MRRLRCGLRNWGPMLVLLWLTSVPAASTAEVTAPTNAALSALSSRLLTRPTDRVLLGQLRDGLRDLTDDASRCRYGVIYYLGCVATGDMPEAVRIRMQLQRFSDYLDTAWTSPKSGRPTCACSVRHRRRETRHLRPRPRYCLRPDESSYGHGGSAAS